MWLRMHSVTQILVPNIRFWVQVCTDNVISLQRTINNELAGRQNVNIIYMIVFDLTHFDISIIKYRMRYEIMERLCKSLWITKVIQ